MFLPQVRKNVEIIDDVRGEGATSFDSPLIRSLIRIKNNKKSLA
jgi:hypothetical protein